HGAVRLPRGSGAVLPGGENGLGELLRQAGAGPGAGGVTGARQHSLGASPARGSRRGKNAQDIASSSGQLTARRLSDIFRSGDQSKRICIRRLIAKGGSSHVDCIETISRGRIRRGTYG